MYCIDQHLLCCTVATFTRNLKKLNQSQAQRVWSSFLNTYDRPSLTCTNTNGRKMWYNCPHIELIPSSELPPNPSPQFQTFPNKALVECGQQIFVRAEHHGALDCVQQVPLAPESTRRIKSVPLIPESWKGDWLTTTNTFHSWTMLNCSHRRS